MNPPPQKDFFVLKTSKSVFLPCTVKQVVVLQISTPKSGFILENKGIRTVWQKGKRIQ